jgi:hypothetical protein
MRPAAWPDVTAWFLQGTNMQVLTKFINNQYLTINTAKTIQGQNPTVVVPEINFDINACDINSFGYSPRALTKCHALFTTKDITLGDGTARNILAFRYLCLLDAAK